MLTLNDGRSELWQWDTGRKLTVDAECSQVHFSNKVFGRSIDVDVVDGIAIIPDILLQTDKDLNVWAFVGTAENGYTKISKAFKVNRRNKPADYVFTPHDQTTLGEIVQRLEELEAMQDPDAIRDAVDEYLASNPIQVEETDPTVPDWAKQPTKPKYTATEVGAIPDTTEIPVVPTKVSAFENDAGYLTEHQKLPEALPNPHPLTFTGAVEATYDGSKAVEVVIPQGGGGVTPTAAEKIVDYTVDADGAAATSFSFTVAEYPKLAEYNHLRGIFRKATNGSIPWVQLLLNTSAHNNNCIGKTAGGNMGMCGFNIIKKGSYYNGGISGPVNTSLFDAWTNQSMFVNSSGQRLKPLYIANLTMVSLASYEKFLDKGGRIEIWGWNE